MKLTIVLTIYNKEAYLRRAFDALLYQDGVRDDDYEILAVNDGSTDGSASIIEEYIKEYERVRVLNQNNQGLSMARNNGVEAAKGDYVWFVDADDTISRNAVSLICGAVKSNPDVIPFYARTEGRFELRNEIPISAKTGEDVLLNGHWQQCGVFWAFRRDFLQMNGLRFKPGIYHEDAEFTPRMLYAAKTINVIPEVLYTVYRAPDSITQVPRPKRAFDYLTVAESLSRFVINERETKTKKGRAIFDQAALCINNGLYVISQNPKDLQDEFNSAFNLQRVHLIQALLKSCHKKYKLEGVIFSLFKGEYVTIYKLLQKLNNKSL